MTTNTTTASTLARLSLKSFKTVRWMSEETICFTATVLLDGKVIGTASNEGHGGCTFVHFTSPTVEATAESFAKSINPADIKGWEFLADKGFTLDCLIDILVEREDKKKANATILRKVKKDLADKVVFVKEGECPKQGYRILKCGADGIAKGVQAMRLKYGNITIYNGQSDEALTAAFCL